MKFTKRLGAFGAAFAAVMVTASPSEAQEAPIAEEQETEDGTLMLAPLTVTGEKTERSIMDTASSVAVFDDIELERRPSVRSTNDIFNIVPNVVSSETSNFAPAIRGIDGTGPAQGADAFIAGTRPRLNYQVDGRTLSYNESIFSDIDLWDVERVEVFRGPQSTLQGRNAIAGAIVVKTKDPTYFLEGAGRIVVGERNTRQASAAVSGPVVDNQIAVRLAVDAREKDHFVDFTPYPEDEDPGRFESLNIRGKVLIEPRNLPDLSALVTVNHVSHEAPQSGDVARPFDAQVPSTAMMPSFRTRNFGGIAEVNYRFSDVWSLATVISATDLRVNRYAPAGTGNLEINANEYVAEPRLKFAFEGISGFVGVHFFDNSQDEVIDLGGGGAFTDDTQTAALFAEAVVELSPALDLTLGGRLEREERDRVGAVSVFAVDFHETYEEFLPKASLAWHIDQNLTLGASIARGYNAGGAGVTFAAPFTPYTYDPEYVVSYEVFSRASLADNRVILTGNLFYNEYEDLQLPFNLAPGAPIPSFVVRNADEAVTYGAEVGARWLATPGLELFANLGLLQTEITSYPGSGIEGNDLPRSPSVTLDIGTYYAAENGLDISLTGRFTDAYHTEAEQKPRGKTDPYWVANAQVGYSFGDARIFIAANNIFDSDEPVAITSAAPLGANLDTATLLEPRTVTVGLEYTF